MPTTYQTKKRITKYALTVVLLLVPTSAAVLSAEGFCFDRWRFLSDAEMIEPVVRTLAEQNQMAIDSTESAIREFLRGNPYCCAVDRHPDRRNWLDVLTGWNIAEVEVNFEMNPKRTYLRGENFYKRYVSVSACGKFLRYGRGTSTATLETADGQAKPTAKR